MKLGLKWYLVKSWVTDLEILMKTFNTDSKGDIFQPTKGTEATALTHQFTPYLKSQDDTYRTLRVHYHDNSLSIPDHQTERGKRKETRNMTQQAIVQLNNHTIDASFTVNHPVQNDCNFIEHEVTRQWTAVMKSFKTNPVLSIYQGSPRSLWDRMTLRTRKPWKIYKRHPYWTKY